jgi:hypothetical protein
MNDKNFPSKGWWLKFIAIATFLYGVGRFLLCNQLKSNLPDSANYLSQGEIEILLGLSKQAHTKVIPWMSGCSSFPFDYYLTLFTKT